MSLIDAKTFIELKERVTKECDRRNVPYTGPLDTKYGTGKYKFTTEPSEGNLILYDHLEKIITPLKAINSTDLKNVNKIISEETLNLIEAKLLLFENEQKSSGTKDYDKGSSYCESLCSGLCYTYCVGGCAGSCGNSSCLGSCGSNCSGCSGGCQDYCSTGCTTDCGTSCMRACSDCHGSCGTSCSYNCSQACASWCFLDACESTCTAACMQTCSVNCDGGNCVGDCSTTCAVGSMYWGGTTG